MNTKLVPWIVAAVVVGVLAIVSLTMHRSARSSAAELRRLRARAEVEQVLADLAVPVGELHCGSSDAREIATIRLRAMRDAGVGAYVPYGSVAEVAGITREGASEGAVDEDGNFVDALSVADADEARVVNTSVESFWRKRAYDACMRLANPTDDRVHNYFAENKKAYARRLRPLLHRLLEHHHPNLRLKAAAALLAYEDKSEDVVAAVEGLLRLEKISYVDKTTGRTGTDYQHATYEAADLARHHELEVSVDLDKITGAPE